MSLEDAVRYLVAVALPVWLLVEQGILWMAASGGDRREVEPGGRPRRTAEVFPPAGVGAPEIQRRAA